MKLHRLLPVVTAMLAVLAGCSGSATSTGGQAPIPNEVVVTVSPATVDLAPGGTATFTATVTGTADTSVTWEVEEGAAGGSVTGAGVYTAPAAAGTYHVAAVSRASPDRRGRATVAVTANPAVGVSVAPRTATVAAGGTVTFTASVTGTANGAVTWSVAEASGCGSVSATGTYTAPGAATTCHVVARSVADPAASDTATVTVTAPPGPVTVTVAPATGAVDACQTLTFRATVTGSTDTAVTWSVQEGTAGGTISAAGVYTAPADAGDYHVVATSHADPARAASATVTVTERVISVSVSPQGVTVAPGGTAQLTATVTTTCGTFASLATLRSDGTIVGN